MGGSVSNNLGKSESSTGSNQHVWSPQGSALQDLYNLSGNMADQSSNYTSGMTNAANQASPYISAGADAGMQGMNYLLNGGAYGNTEDVRNQLMQSLNGSASSPSNTSLMYQSIVGGAGNSYIDPMVAAMKGSAMDNLGRMQSSNALDAAAMGQSGSSRQAMQNAMLGSQVNRDILQQEMNLRGGAYDKDLAMKMNIASLADQNVGAAQDRMLQLLNGANTSVGNGMGFGTQLQNLGMGMLAPTMASGNAGWDYLDRYNNILGAPQVLNSSSGDSKAMSTGSSFGMSAK